MRLRWRWRLVAILLAATGMLALLALAIWRQARTSQPLLRWFTEPDDRAELITVSTRLPCEGAPFLLPSTGLIGLFWGDARLPYSRLHPHSGLDIFGDGPAGQVPVYAAYDGYLTRLPMWRSAVIIRHPQDPLDPTRQIWTYYAHMADEAGNSFIAPEFEAGSSEVPVNQGTLLGYQGTYNGGGRQVGLHLHFSIVRDDGAGRFLNETSIQNTLDPSPYLGMQLDYACARTVPQCSTQTSCP